MADQSGTGSIPWPTLIAVFLALGSASFYFSPLTSERPATTPLKTQSLGYEDVDARLWQDPFRAVETGTDARGDNVKEDGRQTPDVPRTTAEGPDVGKAIVSGQDFLSARSLNPVPHSLEQIKTEISEALGRQPDDQVKRPLLILPVMVQGDSYPEVAEQRLRTRVAVLEGLGIRGYKPVDTVHIGYFAMDWPSARLDSRPAGRFELANLPDKRTFPVLFPYEWCESAGVPMAGSTPPAQEQTYLRVLVLWVNENVFYDFPMARLGGMLRQLISSDPTRGGHADICILGPFESTTLRAMLEEADQLRSPGQSQPTIPLPLAGFDKVVMVSPWATACDAALTLGFDTSPNGAPTSVADLMNNFNGGKTKTFQFTRATHTDDDICDKLVAELHLRNVKFPPNADSNQKCDSIALIGEWDTVYGRALPLTFAAAASGKKLTDLVKHPDQFPTWIRPYVYLRGIDGETAPLLQSENNRYKDSDSQTSSSGNRTLKLNGAPEQPEGNNQLDGLRRLAELLASWDKDLRSRGTKLAAVGILGSDLYDKLLVMRAVRDRLPPGVIFFTTDLDARYNLPSEWKTTHNLIVSSSYGLFLDRHYQGNIPPFRDSLQTASFAAAISAVDPKALPLTKWNELLSNPRIFEIGRSRAFDISVEAASDVEEADRPFFLTRDGSSPHPLQPPRVDLKPILGDVVTDRLSTLLLLLTLLIAILFFLGIRPRLSDPGGNRATVTKVWMRAWVNIKLLLSSTTAFLILIVPAILVFIHFLVACIQSEEPFALFEGVSIWPTEAIRLLAAALSLHFIFKAWVDAKESDADLCKVFHLPASKRRAGLLSALTQSYGPWKVYGHNGSGERYYSLDDFPSTVEPGDKKVYADALWQEYRWRAKYPLRFLRVIPASVLYIGMAYCLMAMLGMPQTPARGAAAQSWDSCITFASVSCATIFIFFVLDATYLNAKFIRQLVVCDTHWPDGAQEEFKRFGLGPEELTEYLDIHVIARRTQVVGKIIYFPFAIFFLMIVSRIGLFDNWDWPLSLLIVLAANIVLSLIAALILRQSAEAARITALYKINERKIRCLANNDQGKADALQLLADDVTQEKGGAFSILSQYPWLAAILLPSGGIGLWMVLQNLAQIFAGQ